MKYVKPINLYREALNINGGRLLGITVRDKGIRLAVSDADNIFSTPLRDLANKKKIGVTQVRNLQSLISAYSISGFVIGYPFERESGLPTAGVQTKRFVDDLTKTGKFEDMNYTFWDEALKSKAVDYLLGHFRSYDSPASSAALTEIVDRCSAWGIVQGYLDFFEKNQDQTNFVGEHGYLEFGNPNPK